MVESQSGMHGLEVLDRYPMVLSFSRYVLVLGCGEMLCRGVGEELTGGETLRGGVRGVPSVLLQCSPTEVLTSSPMALRTGLQLLIACGSGGQHTAAPPPHIAPACTL